jgi:hypothetical protein
MAGVCEHGNEMSDFIKGGEFPHYLNSDLLHENRSDPRCELETDLSSDRIIEIVSSFAKISILILKVLFIFSIPLLHLFFPFTFTIFLFIFCLFYVAGSTGPTFRLAVR